jgi:hypothetical protein
MLAAIAYGIVHDQITARVCVEYFTIGHPRIVDSESPTVLGLLWGVVATWWVGLALGLLLAFAARRGPRPPRSARSLIAPVARLLATMLGVAAIAGLAGWFAASADWVVLLEPLASRVPPNQHVPFIAVLWAHLASYGSGAIGGFWLCSRVWKARQRA